MKSFSNYIAEQDDSEKKGKKISVGKSTVKINPNKDELKEGGDWWHPDPEKDKKLPGVGPKMRAREDRASAKEDPKKLRPGESYMDYAKRQQRSESAVPGKPAERLGAVTAIPQSERDAARERTLAKAKEMREKSKKKNSNESFTFSDFMEARRMDKEGVDRGDTLRANRTARAKASVEAVKKRQAALDKHEKKTGTKLDISRSKEGQAHARNHPGSRQAPKVKGEKETPAETHRRRVNRQVSRVIKHGHTTKEKEANRGIYSSRFD
jgi:hypothetical protein